MKWYNLMLLKAWVDRGRGLTSYFNEIFLILGVWTIAKGNDPWLIILMILGYGVLTGLIGWLYFRFGFEIAEQEVGNQYNAFQKEVRKSLNIRTSK